MPDGKKLIIELTSSNVKIKIDKKGRVYISAPNYLTGLMGLCGNNDGIPNSEYNFFPSTLYVNSPLQYTAKLILFSVQSIACGNSL